MLFPTVVCCLLTLSITAGPSFAAPPVAAPTKQTAQTQVILDNRPLFTISAGVLSFTPADRAQGISKRLQTVAQDRLLNLDQIALDDHETSTDIVLQDQVLMTVTDQDAAANAQKRLELAKGRMELIRQAVNDYRTARSGRSLAIDTAKALAVTLVLVVLLALIRRYFPRLIALIESWRGTRIRTIRLQSIELLHEERAVAMLLSLLRFARIVLIIALFYLYIPLVLSFFPWTAGVAERLFTYIETPVVKVWQGVTTYLPNLFFVAVIAICTHYVIRFSRFLFNEVERQNITLPGFYPDWALPSFKIIRFLIIAFAVVMAFPYLPGSDSPAFKGVSVFLGVLFSLGSTSAVANVVAGVILTYMRAFCVGDLVKIADTMGCVTEKTLLVTRVRTVKNVDITIPNAMVLGSHIINYSSSAQLILNPTVTIGYDVPWRQVHELLIDAARSTDRIMVEPKPFVLQTALNDFNVGYELNAYTDAPSDMAQVYSELYANIQDRFNEAGIEILSPHYSTLRDGNMTTIPADYLPTDYQPPAHRISSVDT
jgi:small-conductance mechanosensitive channel